MNRTIGIGNAKININDNLLILIKDLGSSKRSINPNTMSWSVGDCFNKV